MRVSAIFKKITAWVLPGILLLALTVSAQEAPTITRIATHLSNPRGITVLPDGRLLVAEAGAGLPTRDPNEYTGRLSIFDDLNGDGDYDDPGDIVPIQENLPSYNMITIFNPARDEVLGISDVILIGDGHVFYAVDDHFERISIIDLEIETGARRRFISRPGSLYSMVYDPELETVYVVESTLNGVSAITLEGDLRIIALFPSMAHGQQAVPTGVAIDPNTGDLLVTLFTGQLFAYYGELLSFMPEDATVVRLNPETGEFVDEIVGLTTAIDLAVDENGNIFVVEMTTRWPSPTIAHEFDLYDPDGPPDDGGYARFTGRVTLFPADGGAPVRLADGLDCPTNITYHAGKLYVSTGQGTPGRPIIGPDGRTRIVGEIVQITGW